MHIAITQADEDYKHIFARLCWCNMARDEPGQKNILKESVAAYQHPSQYETQEN